MYWRLTNSLYLRVDPISMRFLEWVLSVLKGFFHQRYFVKEARANFSHNKSLLGATDRESITSAKRYWKEKLGVQINPIWHKAFFNYTGSRDPRFVPHNIWWTRILPFFNETSYRPPYIDKNLAELLLTTSQSVKCPTTVVRRMHGAYYSDNYQALDKNQALRLVMEGPEQQIIKGADTDDGIGIRKLTIENGLISLNGAETSFATLEKLYGDNFLIQHVLRQHHVMAEPHPGSVNTIRILTFRWKHDVIGLMSFARFGTQGKITDNYGTGGICCGIDDQGRLYPTAIDAQNNRIIRHPTTGFDFGCRIPIPGYEKALETARLLHKSIFHFDLVSWDFAIDEEKQPVFLEMNFRGASWVYQMACEKPMFGRLTDEVLVTIQSSISTHKI